MDKYYAQATRRNIEGKPDYTWTAEYSNGNKMLFDTELAAINYAASRCSDKALAMYNPRASKVETC